MSKKQNAPDYSGPHDPEVLVAHIQAERTAHEATKGELAEAREQERIASDFYAQLRNDMTVLVAAFRSNANANASCGHDTEAEVLAEVVTQMDRVLEPTGGK